MHVHGNGNLHSLLANLLLVCGWLVFICAIAIPLELQ